MRPDYLQDNQAADKYQQVPPAPEDHGQRDHRQRERRDPPAGADRVDRAGYVGQPGRPHVGEQAQEPGAGPIPEPEPRRALGEQERADQDDDREQKPRRRADGDRMRQRRGRTGRAALEARPMSGGVIGWDGRDGHAGGRWRRIGLSGRGGRGHGPLDVLAHCGPRSPGSP